MIYNDLSLQQTSFNQVDTTGSDFCNTYLENGNDYFPKNRWGESYGVCWNTSYGNRVFLKFSGDIQQNCLFCALRTLLVNTYSGCPHELAVPISSYSLDCPNIQNFTFVYYCYLHPSFGECIMTLASPNGSCLIFPRSTSSFYPGGGTFIVSGWKQQRQ